MTKRKLAATLYRIDMILPAAEKYSVGGAETQDRWAAINLAIQAARGGRYTRINSTLVVVGR